MKISISYPPLKSEKGVPLLTQNRQFQWFNNPTYIYPMVSSYAASLLQSKGFEVIWDDGIAEELSYEKWYQRIKKNKPDIIALESKTPVIKRHWQIIDELKASLGKVPKVVLMGDHPTAMPEESLRNSSVDYVVSGGDYDFILAELCDYLNGNGKKIPKGLYYKKNRKIINSGPSIKNYNLDSLPFIDRELTKWKLYAYKNGNFKYLPGTYTYTGRDCWWGKCTFCSWTTIFPGKNYNTVSAERHIEEIGKLITDLKVKEIFDDSGCFPKGEWLHEFTKLMVKNGYHKKVVMGANMRVGALSQDEWHMLKQANFRFILIGIESMNQKTLDRLNKGIKIKQIEETVKMAKKAGLEPHITVMVGYPWETKEDAEETIKFAKHLFTKGYIDSLQATIVVPYPGTPMFEEAKKNGWLLTDDWDRYDMRESVWKSPVGTEEVKKFSQDLYKASLNPLFIGRKVLKIRNLNDIKFLTRAGMKVLGHLKDFSKRKKEC